MIDAKAKPQILEHLSKPLTVTIYETRSGWGFRALGTRLHRGMASFWTLACSHGLLFAQPLLCDLSTHMIQTLVHALLCRWVPSSARFVALGSYARNTGCMQVGT